MGDICSPGLSPPRGVQEGDGPGEGRFRSEPVLFRNQDGVVADQVLLKVGLRRQGGLIAVTLGLVPLVVNQGFADQRDSDVQVADLPNLALLERNQCFGGGGR